MSNPIFVETNARISALPGYQNCDYGSKEARQALAIQDAGVSGGGTNLGTSNPTVPGSSTSILAADADRTTVLIQNISGDDIYLQFGVAASLTNGFKLIPDEYVTFGSVYASKEVFAISSAGPSQIVIFTTGV